VHPSIDISPACMHARIVSGDNEARVGGMMCFAVLKTCSTGALVPIFTNLKKGIQKYLYDLSTI